MTLRTAKYTFLSYVTPQWGIFSIILIPFQKLPNTNLPLSDRSSTVHEAPEPLAFAADVSALSHSDQLTRLILFAFKKSIHLCASSRYT